MVKWLTHLAVNQAFVSSILITRPTRVHNPRFVKKSGFFLCFWALF